MSSKIRHVDDAAWIFHLRIAPSRTSSLSAVRYWIPSIRSAPVLHTLGSTCFYFRHSRFPNNSEIHVVPFLLLQSYADIVQIGNGSHLQMHKTQFHFRISHKMVLFFWFCWMMYQGPSNLSWLYLLIVH